MGNEKNGRTQNVDIRKDLKDKKRIVVKVGTSSLTHPETGELNLTKIEVLVRELADLRNMGKDVILVSSGAIGVGKSAIGLPGRPTETSEKQACAAVGQARLMMIYQKLFSEYNQVCGQILLTKNNVVDNLNRHNAQNTFKELLEYGVIPVVNENDTVATYEIHFGDNDTLSAIVAALVEADLLILLSDIDGLYTDDPNTNPDARFIDVVEKLDAHLLEMGKGSSSSGMGTGGMASKLNAAKLASAAGCEMVIANGADFRVIHRILAGEREGTLFRAEKRQDYCLIDEIEKLL